MADAAGPRTLSRRVALGAALTLSLAPTLGCTVGRNSSKPGIGSPPGSGDLDPATTAAISAALDAVLAQQSWMEALAVADPRVGARAERVVAMHRAHHAFLSGLLGSASDRVVPAPAPVPEDRRDVRKAVIAGLAAHEATVTELAVAAKEPALARALASIAAATAQVAAVTGWGVPSREVALPAEPGVMPELERAALQRVLQREHASLWWYGVLGARTSASRQPELFGLLGAGYRAHRGQRDQLDACLRSMAVEPAPAEAAYPVSWPTRSAQQRTQAAGAIEHDAAATYGWLVAQIRVLDEAAPKALVRRWAITALRNAAIRELVGQGTPENFPGVDDIADR